jgi:hypothetical protein
MSIPDFPQQRELDEYVARNPDLIEIYGKAGYSRTIEKQSKELGEKIYSFVKFPTHAKVFVKSLDKLENLYKSEWNPLTNETKQEVQDMISDLKEGFIKGDAIEEEAEKLKDTLDFIFDPLSLEEDFGNKKEELDSVVHAIIDFQEWRGKKRRKRTSEENFVRESLLKAAKLYTESPWMHSPILTVDLLISILGTYTITFNDAKDEIYYIGEKLPIPLMITLAIAYFYPSLTILFGILMLFVLYLCYQRWKNKKIFKRLNFVYSEISIEGYDGEEISHRLHKLEAEGITLPSIVYPLLKLKHKPSSIN